MRAEHQIEISTFRPIGWVSGFRVIWEMLYDEGSHSFIPSRFWGKV